MAFQPKRNCVAMKEIAREVHEIADIFRNEDTGEMDNDLFSHVMDMMEDMKPEELGAIAACGSGLDAKGKKQPINDACPISSVLKDHKIGESDSGLLILRKVAAAAVIANVEQVQLMLDIKQMNRLSSE